MGTIYRHFPTRADLIIAVYRHQVEACAEAGPALLASSPTPHAALGRWIDLFVDFLVTKHGLAAVLQSDDAGFETLHAYFLDRLVPVCAQLLDAAAAAGEIRSDLDAYELMRGIGNLCIGADSDPRYDAAPTGRDSSSRDCADHADHRGGLGPGTTRAICTRLFSPSLVRMWDTCAFTVGTLMYSDAKIGVGPALRHRQRHLPLPLPQEPEQPLRLVPVVGPRAGVVAGGGAAGRGDGADQLFDGGR